MIDYNIKSGDKVELISIEKEDNESQNWIVEAIPNVEIGWEFIIARTLNDNGDRWIRLKNVKYWHPISKFRKTF